MGPEHGVLKHSLELRAGPGHILPAVLVQEGEEVQQALMVELSEMHAVHGIGHPSEAVAEPANLMPALLSTLDIYG